MKGKKGQEESVGFVAVVVVVIIIGVIVLGFLISRESSSAQKESRDVYRFLESSNSFTSTCVIGYEPLYQDVLELTKVCLKDSSTLCLDGSNACIVLNKTLEGLLISGWGEIDSQSKVKGYIYSSTYVTNRSGELNRESIIDIRKGECTGNFIGYTYPISYLNGKIEISLRLCSR